MGREEGEPYLLLLKGRYYHPNPLQLLPRSHRAAIDIGQDASALLHRGDILDA